MTGMKDGRLGRLAIAACLGCVFGLAASPAQAQAQKAELVAPTQLAAEPVPYPEGGHGPAEVVLELGLRKTAV